jgi:hypothetical protein
VGSVYLNVLYVKLNHLEWIRLKRQRVMRCWTLVENALVLLPEEVGPLGKGEADQRVRVERVKIEEGDHGHQLQSSNIIIA